MFVLPVPLHMRLVLKSIQLRQKWRRRDAAVAAAVVVVVVMLMFMTAAALIPITEVAAVVLAAHAYLHQHQ